MKKGKIVEWLVTAGVVVFTGAFLYSVFLFFYFYIARGIKNW
jgi:hypothetical protein